MICGHVNTVCAVCCEQEIFSSSSHELLLACVLFMFIPTKARDYVFTGVGLSVCLSGKVPRGKSKPKFVFGYDR